LDEPLSVGVLITLVRGSGAGGHVKCWERFAEAAIALPPGTLDLTIYTLGADVSDESWSSSVRFCALPPRLSTARFSLLAQDAGHTDLAPYHARLARRLGDHTVLHTTDSFSFARTALRVARGNGQALVASIHTDLPAFTRVYSREIIGQVVGTGRLGRLVLDAWNVPDRLGRRAERRVGRLLRSHDRVLVSKDADRTFAEPLVGADRVSWLRRGIDLDRFHPRHRDRARLAADLGIPDDRPLLLFVGRADDSKRVMTVGHAARHLLDEGMDLHVLVVGEGKRRVDLSALLGAHATVPGALPQERLPMLYASADLFVFPSESEVSPNVVLEARASGLPVLLSVRDGGARFVARSGEDGILMDDPAPDAWAKALRPMLANPEARTQMGCRARAVVEATAPTWRTVLEQDLFPAWQAAAAAVSRR